MAKLKKSSKADKKRKTGCNLAYKGEQRHEKSHVKRIKKHLNRYSANDRTACDSLMKYAEKLGLNHFNSAKEFLKEIRRNTS